MIKEAVIDGPYRYSLLRVWEEELPRVLFVMLNPSTADASIDDPTITRCINFAKLWGFGGLMVGNCFAYRSTDPKYLLKPTTAPTTGPLNEHYLNVMKEKCSLVIFAWGTHKAVTKDKERKMRLLFPDACCITISKNGKPVHPLYLNKTLTPIKFK